MGDEPFRDTYEKARSLIFCMIPIFPLAGFQLLMEWTRKQRDSVKLSALHVATFFEPTVGELPDLRQNMPLLFFNVGEHVRAFSNRHRFGKDRHTQNVDNLQSNSDALP